MMAAGARHVVSFFREPKLIALESGAVVHTWRGLASGRQTSSICHHHEPPPPLALDPERGRFAIFSGERLTIVTLRLGSLS